MDVDQGNLTEALKLIGERLPKAEFITLHCLTTNRIDKELAKKRYFFDDQEEYYRECLNVLRESPDKFQPIEFGFVIWRRDQEGGVVYQKFNVPVFPQNCSLLPRSSRDRFLSLNASTIDALGRRNFNYNAWIKKSISTLNIFDDEKAKERLKQNDEQAPDLQLQGEDKEFIESFQEKIKEFLDSSEQSFEFPPCNAYKRRLLYMTFKAEPYSTVIFLQSSKQNKDAISVTKISKEEVAKRKEDYYNKQIGVLSIFKLIIQHQKPLIGFNIFHDLFVYYSTFWTFPPDALTEFKEIFRSLFPSLYDIRLMSLGVFNNDSVDILCKELEVALSTELPDEPIQKSDHDAFKIGFCFVKLLNHFHREATGEEKLDISDHEKYSSKFLNKVGLSENFDLNSIDLCQEDTLPPRPKMFHVKVDIENRYIDVEDWLKEFELETISWLNEDEVIVRLHQDEKVMESYEALKEDLKKSFTILPFADYYAEKKSQEQDEEEYEELEESIENELDIASLNKTQDSTMDSSVLDQSITEEAKVTLRIL